MNAVNKHVLKRRDRIFAADYYRISGARKMVFATALETTLTKNLKCCCRKPNNRITVHIIYMENVAISKLKKDHFNLYNLRLKWKYFCTRLIFQDKKYDVLMKAIFLTM